MDADDPSPLFAGMWQIDIKTWKNNDGGPGGGAYVTHDAGRTWEKLAGGGLPGKDETGGKTAVQVAPGNPDRVYALIEQGTAGPDPFDDGGQAWEAVDR